MIVVSMFGVSLWVRMVSCRMGNPPILLDYQHCGIQAEFGEAHLPNGHEHYS